MKGLRKLIEFTSFTAMGIFLIYLFSHLFALLVTKDGRVDNFLFHEIKEYLILYLLVFWVFGVTYKKTWDFQLLNKRKFLLFVFCLILTGPVLM